MSSRSRPSLAPIICRSLLLCSLGVALNLELNWQAASSAQSLDEETTANPYQYLKTYINTLKSQKMLNSEPLKSDLLQALGKHRALFKASREQTLQVTQIMQGYILSEGQDKKNEKRSLVMIDVERQALMIVLVDIATKKFYVVQKINPTLSLQELAEMQEYADEWGLSELGLAP